VLGPDGAPDIDTTTAMRLRVDPPRVTRLSPKVIAGLGKPLFLRRQRPLQPTALGLQPAANGRRILTESRRAPSRSGARRGGLRRPCGWPPSGPCSS
ncbi:MAG TPA: hypothetical protein PKC84_01930, partial [Paracoccaceae bacterium]|nr:hypothetical protein [Paracoccaceae bacterium]